MLQHCSFTYEQCCNTARLHTSSVFPSKLKLNTDPEAEPYGIHCEDTIIVINMWYIVSIVCTDNITTLDTHTPFRKTFVEHYTYLQWFSTWIFTKWNAFLCVNHFITFNRLENKVLNERITHDKCSRNWQISSFRGHSLRSLLANSWRGLSERLLQVICCSSDKSGSYWAPLTYFFKINCDNISKILIRGYQFFFWKLNLNLSIEMKELRKHRIMLH